MSEQERDDARLTGWKEIGAYLGRSPRTVQRWERDYALPVHRSAAGRIESVVAFPAEIDAWLKSTSGAKAHAGASHVSTPKPPPRALPAPAPNPLRPRRPTPSRRTIVLTAAATVLVIAGAVATWRATASRVETGPLSAPMTDAVAVYHLDEGRGDQLLDASRASSGRGRATGSVVNGEWTTGVSGRALDFAPGHHTGQELHATFPGTFPFHEPGDASLSFWLRPLDATHRTVFWTRGDAHSPDANRFHIYTGGVQRMVGPALGIDYLSPAGALHLLFEVPIHPGVWTHVALVRRGQSRYTLYLNGAAAGTADDVDPQLPDYRGNWAMWRTQDNPYPRQNAAVDEIAIWTRALSVGEVRRLARRTP